MKQFFKMFFASLLSLIVGSVVIVFIVIGIIASIASSSKKDKEAKVNENSILLIETNKHIHEQSESNSLSFLNENGGYSAGLYDIIHAIEYAQTDKNIKGIMLQLSSANNGWATLHQLRSALTNFKKSGKFIYAYGEIVPQKSYFIASVADSIFLNPVGFTEFNGLASEIPFFKGTLEKLEVEPEIFYAGKFKSATEPFRCDKMSEPNKIQITALQSEIWTEFINAVAQHAGTDANTINDIAQKGAVLFPQDAVNYKLANSLHYKDEVESQIRKKTGQKENDKIKYVAIDDYAVNAKNSSSKSGDSRIAILMAEGNISDGESNDDFEIASDNMIEEIVKLRKNDKVKAVVLRVNSPGGSALASEDILHELNLLQAKKPLIVSMGDVAASGGYYISCQADSIFALPNTITGSIGVFTMLFNSQKLLQNKLGITFDQVKNAPYADFPSLYRPMNDGEKQKMQAGVDSIYALFKRRVAAGRKMDATLVDSFAQGRVWSGKQALKLGLIDGLGNIDRAIASAAAKAKLKDYKVVVYPEPVDKLEKILKKLGDGNVTETAVKSAIEKEMISPEFKWFKDIKSLMKTNGRAQMAMPFSIDIK